MIGISSAIAPSPSNSPSKIAQTKTSTPYRGRDISVLFTTNKEYEALSRYVLLKREVELC